MGTAFARLSKIELLLGIAVMGPALALGGTSPWVVPCFAAIIAALVAITLAQRKTIPVPLVATIAIVMAALTALQVMPIPGLRAALAPVLDTWIAQAQVGVEGSGWPSISPAPADTALEAVRLFALAGLALCCAQRAWQRTAAAVALLGVLVATIGLLQYGLGIDQIYGLYSAQHGARELSPALLSTFVSPNHQSGLLLVSLMATAGLLVDSQRTHHGAHGLDRRIALLVALALQLAALVLSLSRAALLVAMLVGPIAVTIAWWPDQERRGSPWSRLAPKLGLGLVLVGIALGLGSVGAWQELQTLVVAEGLDPSTAARLRVTTASYDLIDLAPLTGIGRGAYGDVFTAFDPAPTHVWYSHLECAPLTFVVEWGVIVGGALAVAAPAWWIAAMRRSGTHEDHRARRIVLLGLLALALQSLADFSLEFLGVAAPAMALAGALDSTQPRRSSTSRARWGAVVLAGMAVASMLLVPSTWAFRGRSITHGGHVELAARPLDAGRHRQHARLAAAAGDWEAAHDRARIAVRLEPGQVDGWLLLGASARALGDTATMQRATANALARLHTPPDEALLHYLTASFADPATLARVSPQEGEAWRLLAAGLLEHSPAHADAMAAIRMRRAPDDAEALHVRVEANLRLRRPALALHYARLWRQRAPTLARAHLAVARALQIAPRPRPDDVRLTLERALREASIDDQHERGLIEEQLLRALLRLPDTRAQARQVAAALRTRPAESRIRSRWRELFLPVLEGKDTP